VNKFTNRSIDALKEYKKTITSERTFLHGDEARAKDDHEHLRVFAEAVRSATQEDRPHHHGHHFAGLGQRYHREAVCDQKEEQTRMQLEAATRCKGYLQKKMQKERHCREAHVALEWFEIEMIIIRKRLRVRLPNLTPNRRARLVKALAETCVTPEAANMPRGSPLVGPVACMPRKPTITLARDSSTIRNHTCLNLAPSAAT